MITKEQFEKVYNKYPPKKAEIFYFKYFSQQTLQENKWLGWLVALILFIPFLFGFIFAVLNKIELAKIPALVQAGLLVAFAIPWITVWYIHLFRIRRIRKELGVSREEYKKLVDKFYYNRVDLETYIKNRVK